MTYLKSEQLNAFSDLLHAFTTKKEGFSLAPFLGNNLAYHVQDNPLHVNKNHLFLAQDLLYKQENLAYMNQVHGNNIVHITSKTDLKQIPSCDALITQEKNIPLMVMVADCIPLLLYDPVQEVISVIHAGRAGVFNKLIPSTLSQMQSTYSCKSKDIIVSLGPSIHACCYEVGKEIKKEAEALNYGFSIKKQNKSYFLDLLSIVKEQLKEANIKETHIEISSYCTACNTDLLYSYRKENKCGRFAGVIMQK